MDFGKIFTRAGEIIWRFKILWIFGILAGCGSQTNGGSGGGGQTNYQVSPDDPTFDTLPPAWQNFLWQAERFFERNAETIVAVALILVLISLILAFVFMIVRSFGTIGLVKGTLKAEAGEGSAITWANLSEEAQPYLWRVFGLNFLLAIAVIIVVLMLFGFGILTFGIGFLCIVPILCLLVPVGWLAYIIITQSTIAIVAEDLSISEGLSRGWNIFRDNLGGMVIVGLILGIGGAIIGVIIGLPQLLSVIPMVTGFMSGELMQSPENFFESLGISIIIALAYWPIFITLRGILTAYINSAWTLTYLETQKAEPDVVITEEPPALEPAA
jgi:hypothetical protein